jgi:hypothetical protein
MSEKAIEVDVDNLWKYTGFKDDGYGVNANYSIDVDDPNLELYTDIRDKTHIYYNNRLINREYLELPIYLSKGGYSGDDDYTCLSRLIAREYPEYTNPELYDKFLKKQYKYNVTQGLQKMLQYMKDIQNEVKTINEKEPWEYKYRVNEHNFPIRDYFEMAEWGHDLVGKRSDICFLHAFAESTWFHLYTPNSWVDVKKLKSFIKKYRLEKYLNDPTLDDEYWMKRHSHFYDEWEY